MLWLVTPAHGREALTRVVFEQRARMLAELEDVRQLVVGEGANLDTAREFGFDVLRRDNIVGHRVNEGIEWAVREGGATHVAYCGSDDWHLADYFRDLPDTAVKTCRWQAFVPPAGDRLVVIRQTAAAGSAPWIVPRVMLMDCGYRPANETGMSAIDSSIADSVLRGVDLKVRDWKERRFARRRAFHFDDGADWLRMVDFKGGAEQITPWERVVGTKRPREFETDDPWAALARVYPADLVERMQKFYAEEAR